MTTAIPALRPAARASAPAAPRPIRKLAIVIRDDAWDRLLTPLTFAWESARRGAEVDVLFVLWAVRVLSRDGVGELRIAPSHTGREDWLRQRLARDREPTSIHDFLKALKATGRVRLHACRLAAMTFDVTEADLLPEAEGILDPSDFLAGIVTSADHCQYF